MATRTSSGPRSGCAPAPERPGSPFRRGDAPSAPGVVGGALELDADERLVAEDPGIVARLDHVRIAGADVNRRTVVVDDVDLARNDVAEVRHLAAVGARHGLDALRPPPAGLEGEAPHLVAADPDHVDLGLLRRTALVGLVEVAGLHACHRCLLGGWTQPTLIAAGLLRARPLRQSRYPLHRSPTASA